MEGKLVTPLIQDGREDNPPEEPDLEGLEFDSGGLLRFRGHGSEKWGWINRKGDWEIEPEWDSSTHFFESGIAVVRRGPSWGAVDRSGELVIPLEYSPLLHEVQGSDLMPAAKGGKWGAITTSGEVVLDFVWESVWVWPEGPYFLVGKNGKVGLLGPDGNELVPAEWDGIYAGEETSDGKRLFGKLGLARVWRGWRLGVHRSAGRGGDPCRVGERPSLR